MQNKSSMISKHPASKTLIGLAGLVAFVLMLNSILALFGLYYANQQHISNLSKLTEMMQTLEAARTAQVHFKKQVQEWKNTLLRGQKQEDFKKYSEYFYRDEQTVQQKLQDLKVLAEKIGLDTAPIRQVQQTHKELGVSYRSALKAYAGSDPQTIFLVDSAVRGIDRAPTDAMDEIVERIWKQQEQLVLKIREETASQYDTWWRIIIPGAVIGILLVFGLLWVSSRS